MSIQEVKDKKRIASLFYGWEETLIWSCLQNCMGKAYADPLKEYQSAKIMIGDFCFLAGEPDFDLALFKPLDYKENYQIIVPQNKEWETLIEQAYKGAKKYHRFAFHKSSQGFNKEYLRSLGDKLTKEYEWKFIDEESYHKILQLPWAVDMVSQFVNYEDYKKRGLGVIITTNGEIVSGASSYTVYQEGIEIEIDTRNDHRRKGLATVCASHLILECLNRGIYPSWDAQNVWSKALAEKLGYSFAGEYPVYEIEFL